MIKSLLFAVFCMWCSVGVAAQDERDLTFCLAKDDAWNSVAHKIRMKELNTNCATLYYKLMSAENRAHPYDWIKDNYLDSGHDVVLTLILDNGVTSTVGSSEGTDVSAGVPGLLERVVGGEFDKALNQLIAKIVKDGRHIVVRPMHEIDGGWYPWGIYAKGNSPELAVAAVKHVVTMFKAAHAPVTFEINFNRRDARDKVLGEAERYLPQLDQLVDAYSVSSYNRCGTAPKYQKERSFADDFRPIYEKLAGLTNKPINVAEVSTSGECSPRLPWFREMLKAIDTEFTRVEMVTFYFGTVPIGKASNTKPIQWGLNSNQERLAFRDLLNQYRQKWHTKLKQEKVLKTKYAFRAPWSVSAQLIVPFDETANPALNPVTGNEFGETGSVLRIQLQQRMLFDAGNGFEAGPGVRFGLVESPNDNQWWNNQSTAGVSFGLYRDLPKGNIQWGGWSVELYAERRQFTTSAPDRYKGNSETWVGIRAGFNVGGDWTH